MSELTARDIEFRQQLLELLFGFVPNGMKIYQVADLREELWRKIVHASSDQTTLKEEGI